MQNTYQSDGIEVAARNLGYSFTGRQVIFNGTTSYTPTSGTLAILIQAVGGGGSGGGSGSTAVSASAGSGGGSGSLVESFITSLPASPITVAVGAGGTAPAAGNNNGNNGGDTTFNTTTLVAKGGLAGSGGGAGATTPTFVVGGGGGPASGGTGDVKFDGNSGGDSYVPSGTVGCSGYGAVGPFGGSAIARNTQTAGAVGGNYGSGGSGGLTLNGGATTAGGAGAPGIMIIWEFA